MKKSATIIGLSMVGLALTVSAVFAAGPKFGGLMMNRMEAAFRAPGILGTVTAISSNTITVNAKGFGQNASQTTYTVDATNAKVTKNGTASTVSAIAVGDTIMVQGSLNGTTITAVFIRDGLPQNLKNQTPLIQGNGQPIIGGTITAISAPNLTVTTKTNSIAYSVNASGATVVKGNATTTLSSLSVGDQVIVQGAVNGTSVTASSIIDQDAPKTPNANSNSNTNQGGFMNKVFRGIGNFFHNLFGFF